VTLLKRYARIDSKFRRELLLLQGTGCIWKQCTFCDYHKDFSEAPFITNKIVLNQVSGLYHVLDIINSGSAMELDFETISYLQKIVLEKRIEEIWFEAHYLYRDTLCDFAALFPSSQVKFRCGVESFSAKRRGLWHKGIPSSVGPEDIAKYFKGICLLIGVKGQTREEILFDIEMAKKYFEYFSVNIFCNNTAQEKQDEGLVNWFMQEIYPVLRMEPKAEILIENTDLGVG
jgi:hypothetical protein